MSSLGWFPRNPPAFSCSISSRWHWLEPGRANAPAIHKLSVIEVQGVVLSGLYVLPRTGRNGTMKQLLIYLR